MNKFFSRVGLEVNMTDALSLSQSIDRVKALPDSEDKVHVINRKFLTNL